MNTNMIEGWSCPGCGSLGSFLVESKVFVRISDDGIEDYRDVEWDNHNEVHCCACGDWGTVREFQSQSNPPMKGLPNG